MQHLQTLAQLSTHNFIFLFLRCLQSQVMWSSTCYTYSHKNASTLLHKYMILSTIYQLRLTSRNHIRSVTVLGMGGVPMIMNSLSPCSDPQRPKRVSATARTINVKEVGTMPLRSNLCNLIFQQLSLKTPHILLNKSDKNLLRKYCIRFGLCNPNWPWYWYVQSSHNFVKHKYMLPPLNYPVSVQVFITLITADINFLP